MKWFPKISDVSKDSLKEQGRVTKQPPSYTSFQSQPVDWEKIRRKDGFFLQEVIEGTNGSNTGNYTHFFITYHSIEVVWISEVHAVAGTDANDVTLGVERLDDGVAPGSGDSLIVTEFDLKGTVNTVVEKTDVELTDNTRLTSGQRLGLTVTGNPTNVDGVCVTLYCHFANRGGYI